MEDKIVNASIPEYGHISSSKTELNLDERQKLCAAFLSVLYTNKFIYINQFSLSVHRSVWISRAVTGSRFRPYICATRDSLHSVQHPRSICTGQRIYIHDTHGYHSVLLDSLVSVNNTISKCPYPFFPNTMQSNVCCAHWYYFRTEKCRAVRHLPHNASRNMWYVP